MPEVRVHLRQIGPSTSEASLPGGHTVLLDRPEAKGGAEEGPLGGEYFGVVAGAGA